MENYKPEGTVEINVYDYQELVTELTAYKTRFAILDGFLATRDYLDTSMIKKILGMEDKNNDTV